MNVEGINDVMRLSRREWIKAPHDKQRFSAVGKKKVVGGHVRCIGACRIGNGNGGNTIRRVNVIGEPVVGKRCGHQTKINPKWGVPKCVGNPRNPKVGNRSQKNNRHIHKQINVVGSWW